MKLAIMQPYLFPYAGYFQLVAASDRFVFYDDVNFIKNGWINRNRILLNGQPHYLTVPLSGASHKLPINQVRVVSGDAWRARLCHSLRHAYARAPHFDAVNTLFNRVINTRESRIGEIAKSSIRAVAEYLCLPTEFVPSSTIYDNQALAGAERVIDICSREQAGAYLNLPGGRHLYDRADFAAAGIDLRFIEPATPCYRQGRQPFQAGLSILDVLMFNAPNEATKILACQPPRMT